MQPDPHHPAQPAADPMAEGICPDGRGAMAAGPARQTRGEAAPARDHADPRLAFILNCPDRVPIGADEVPQGPWLSARAECLAGKGRAGGRVELRECLDCASAVRPGGGRRPFRGDVLIRAALTSWTGYGQVAEWLGRGLESLGLRIGYVDSGTDLRYYVQSAWVAERKVWHEVDAPWTLVLDVPQAAAPGGRVVRFTMWETSRVSAAAVASLNRAELVCVPCEANRLALAESGVVAPVEVVPLGINPEDGYRDDGTPPPSGICRIGMAGRMAHGKLRKGLNEGMEAFIAAFPASVSDVELVVKVWPDCLPHLRVPADPRIRIISTPMTPAALANWYRTLTALLVPSKGEGWGLHTHQAMAVGRPVIAARWGGTAEFWDERFGWGLDYDLAPAGESFAGHGEWAVPRLESMVERLRQVHADRESAAEKGRLASWRAAEFTWDRAARRLRRALVDSGLLDAKLARWTTAVAGVDSHAAVAGTDPGPEPESAGIPIVIMTVARPETYLERTLESLAPRRPVTLMVGSTDSGYLEPYREDPLLRVVVPEAGEYARVERSGVGQRAAWNYWRCLGAGEGSSRLLVFEDDVRFALGWEERLAGTIGRIERDHVDYVLSLYYPYQAADDRGAGYVPYRKEAFFGTQGMLFAGRALEGFRAYLLERGIESWLAPYDLLLQGYTIAEETPLLASMPSLVQHIGDRTTGLSGGFHTAPSFMERVARVRGVR